MSDTEPRHKDTHPFPHVTLREHPCGIAGPSVGKPTFTVFLTGWWFASYKTRAGAERGAARAGKIAAERRLAGN